MPVFEAIVESTNTVSLPEGKEEEFSAAIDQLEDQEKAEMLRNIFGLN